MYHRKRPAVRRIRAIRVGRNNDVPVSARLPPAPESPPTITLIVWVTVWLSMVGSFLV